MADARQNRVFKPERRDIKFPMWRKKVDASIFVDRAILIPNFAAEMWNIAKAFKGVNSRKASSSEVSIHFDGGNFCGAVTELGAEKRHDSYRIFYGEDLGQKLKESFPMSYVRDLEFKLGREQYTTDTKRVAIEDVIPFNEFLDVEWDESRRTFIFTAHYKQPPTFPCLFNELIGSVFAAHVENKLDGKKPKVISSPWYPRAELNRIKEAENVIYYLLDEDQCELYVGEARFLKKRLGVNRKEIRSWTHFRFDVLPGELEPMRVAIERMVITAIAYMFPNNKQGLVEKRLSDFKLNNKKID